MLSISQLLSGSTGGYIGAAMGAYDVISSFTNHGGSSTSVQYGSGTIQLQGSITTKSPVNFIALGLHHSQHSYAPNNSALNFPGNLGLFSLSRPLRFEAGQDYLKLLDDPGSLILVNPHSEMQLSEVKIQPMFSTNYVKFNACCRTAPLIVPVNNNFSLIPTKGGILASDLLKAKSMLDSTPSQVLTTWYPVWTGYVPGTTLLGKPVDVWQTMATKSWGNQAKMYLRFTHKTNPAIYSEFVRTYPAEIVRTECTLRRDAVALPGYASITTKPCP